MAPEIGAGNYGCSIDIYALGILLYEMLTGDVPFGGSSPAEILMKHMTDTPMLDNIEEPFATVIKKALAKDPEDRYKTVQEMVEDLYGSENIRNSVSHFSPDELSVIAERVAAKANIGDRPGVQKPKAVAADEHTRDVGRQVANGPAKDVGKQITETAQRFARQADAFGKQVADKVDAKMQFPAIADSVDPNQRRTLAFLTMAMIAVGTGLLTGPRNILPTALVVFVMTAICSKVILFTRQRWFTNLEPESQWIPRIGMCCVAALLASMAAGILSIPAIGRSGFGGRGFPFPMGPPFGIIFGGGATWLAIAIPMFLVNWSRISSPQRVKRLSLGSAIWIGLLGLMSSTIFGQGGFVVAAVLAGTSLVVQAYSPFGKVTQTASKAQPKKPKQEQKQARPTASLIGRPVPPYFRVCSWIGCFVTLGLGIFLLIMSAAELRGEEAAIATAAGVDSLILSVYCLIWSYRKRFTGRYRYFIRPWILVACLMSVVTSAIYMGYMNLRGDEFLVALFFIIFPAVGFLAIAIIPARFFGSIPNGPAPQPVAPPAPSVSQPSGVSSFKRLWALLLCAVGMSGFPAGLHRFYTGKIGTGILWFLTCGLFFVGQIIDLILIITGQFKDRYGKPIEIWLDKEELRARKRGPTVAAEAPVPGCDVAAAISHQAEEPHSPAAEYSPPQPAPAMPTASVMFERFHPLAFLFAGIGFILTFLAMAVGLAHALHIPDFMATDPGLARDLEDVLGSNWPQIIGDMAKILFIVLMLPAAVCISLGRRHLGARHLIRGILGLGGLLAAVLMLADGMYWGFHRRGAVNYEEFGSVLERVLKGLQSEGALFAAILFVAAVVILAWPARTRKTILTPALNQGLN